MASVFKKDDYITFASTGLNLIKSMYLYMLYIGLVFTLVLYIYDKPVQRLK